MPKSLRHLPIDQIKRAGFATFLRLLATSLSLSFSIFGAQLLGAKFFGEYVSFFAVAGLLTVATSIGLPALLQREISASRGSGDRHSLPPLAQGLLLLNGILLVSLGGAIFTHNHSLSIIIAFCLAGNAAGVFASIYSAHEKVILASLINDVVRPASALLALFALSLISTPSSALPMYAQIIGTSTAIVTFFLLWQGEPLTKGLSFLRSDWWSERHLSMLRTGWIFASTQFLINLTTQIDVLILTALTSPEDVAHYYAAARAALVINFFYGASGLVAEPLLTRLYAAGDKQEFQKNTTRTAYAGAIVTIIAAIASIFVAPFYLNLYGPDFSNALPAYCVVVLGLALRSLFGPTIPLLRATRSDGTLLLITAVVIAINAALSISLVPHIGILGAAIGSGVQFSIYGLILGIALWRQTSIRPDVFILARSNQSN
ncbi:lipopolysaccharide biosynthesis protein [Hyphomonas sp. CY54-11-8]|uniref:lipopolysaccharide biosynthesis protein n=1 Tax=Hyphomonas sp. CY54-11-8 TaxID=1280944 RepID=UPI000458BFA6|nr:lipopolysaccharide biosynthesis protein [Hyphomonas sp. CY54-11-8]KCZ47243.1 hypothetical protein HY17_19060 [Hyphomonas sp. CY54-11-8]